MGGMEKHSARNMNGILIKVRGISISLILTFCTLLANANPDHLEPVPPASFLGYEEAVLTSLISEKDPRFWMLVFPQQDAQYAIILNEIVEYDKNYYEVKKRHWALEYVRLKEKIPLKKLSTSEINELVCSREVKQYHLVVTEDFAKKMEEAWLDVLKQTRYPDKKVIAWNGTSFVFYYRRDRFGDYYGMTTSPKNGQPAMLVELGQKLIALVQAEEKDREAIQKQCLEIASKIIQKK